MSRAPEVIVIRRRRAPAIVETAPEPATPVETSPRVLPRPRDLRREIAAEFAAARRAGR